MTVKYLMPFPTAYIYKSRFSVLVALKLKYWNKHCGTRFKVETLTTLTTH
jgi:hypothetical protein